MSVYDYRDRPAYSNTSWPPYTNQSIAKWWTGHHDELIERLIKDWQWNWYWEVADAVVAITPKDDIASFLTVDAWYNKIMKFAATRANTLGLTKRIRQPKWKLCPLCHESFIEDSLPHPLVKRLGVNDLDFCAPCLRDTVLQGSGNDNLSQEQILNYIRDLTDGLQRIPHQGFGEGMDDFRDMDFEQRLAILRLLQRKPTTQRVKDLFDSWLHALIESGVLEDDALRTSRGIHCLARDGHRCLSLGEKTIDDFLYAHAIPHQKEPSYPEANYRADFVVNSVLIEYFGLQGDPEYDKKTKEKQRICKKCGVELIAIYPRDLINIRKLEEKLLGFLSESPQN